MKAFKGLIFLTCFLCCIIGICILVRIPFMEEKLSTLTIAGISLITILSGFVLLKLNKKTQL